MQGRKTPKTIECLVVYPEFHSQKINDLLRQLAASYSDPTNGRFLDTTEPCTGTAFFEAVRVHQLIRKSE